MAQLDLFSQSTSRAVLNGRFRDLTEALKEVQNSLNTLYDVLGVQNDGTIVLPDTDPEVEGELWSDSGVVTISSGPA